MRIGKCPKCKAEMHRHIRFSNYYVKVCPNCKTDKEWCKKCDMEIEYDEMGNCLCCGDKIK